MVFLIQPNWNLIYREVIHPLTRSISAPPDMFIELLRFASVKLGVDINVEALSDPSLAKKYFKKLPFPSNEEACITLLEGYYDILKQFDTGIAERYQLKLKEFIDNRNLRYVILPNCKLQLSVLGLLVSQYSILKKSLDGNEPRKQCLNELELGVGKLKDEEGERNCIRIASNLLEGVVTDKTTNGETTLGRAITGCKECFPHESLIDCTKNFYKFLNDYPNLRHPGHQTSKIRELKKDDAIFAVSFALVFSSYIAENNGSHALLIGDI